MAAAPQVLVAARVVQGVGAALVAPATLAVLNTSFTEPNARARAFGAWSAAGGVGGMAGAIAGGAITTGLSWRWVFLINVPIGAVLVVVAVMALAGVRALRRQSLDLAGAVTGTAGLAVVVYGVMQSADQGWVSVLVVGPIVAGLLLLVVFTVVEARFAAQPMMPLRLFRVRGVAVGNGMLLLFGAIPIAMWYFTSLFLQDVLGHSALQAGLGQTPAAVAFLLVARWAAPLLPRWGVRPLVLAGSACFLVGFGVGGRRGFLARRSRCGLRSGLSPGGWAGRGPCGGLHAAATVPPQLTAGHGAGTVARRNWVSRSVTSAGRSRLGRWPAQGSSW